MAVLLFERQFWRPILDRTKVHSIRGPRKRPIRAGDALSLRGWEGVAYRSPQRTLADVVCVRVRECRITSQAITIDELRIVDPEHLDAFAVSDGFASWRDLLAYRGFNYGFPFSGVLYQWDVHPLLSQLETR